MKGKGMERRQCCRNQRRGCGETILAHALIGHLCSQSEAGGTTGATAVAVSG